MHNGAGCSAADFMLNGSKLSYFESLQAANKGRAKGTVVVTHVGHVTPDHAHVSLPVDKVTLAFHFDTAEKKPFVVYAVSLKEKLAWLRALADAIRVDGSVRYVPIEDMHKGQV